MLSAIQQGLIETSQICRTSTKNIEELVVNSMLTRIEEFFAANADEPSTGSRSLKNSLFNLSEQIIFNTNANNQRHPVVIRMLRIAKDQINPEEVTVPDIQRHVYLCLENFSNKVLFNGVPEAFAYVSSYFSALNHESTNIDREGCEGLNANLLDFIIKLSSMVQGNSPVFQNSAASLLSRMRLRPVNSPGSMGDRIQASNQLTMRYGRTFAPIQRSILDALSDEAVVKKLGASYLQFVDNFGVNRLNKNGRELLHRLLGQDNFDILNYAENTRQEARRLVKQARCNNLYFAEQDAGKFENRLSIEEINQSYKKALIALQSKEIESYGNRFDHLDQLLSISNIPNKVALDNLDLFNETLDIISDEIIPDGLFIKSVLEATHRQKMTKYNLNKKILNRFLIHCQESLAPRLESVDMQRIYFLDLLEMFVSNNWNNSQTYNSFIMGFGESFDEMSDSQAVRFIELLTRAGLNQVDILEAVIDKVINSKDRRRT